jgi:mannose-1-phosphate guanylyltransferase
MTKSVPNLKVLETGSAVNRWAVILAGGDGTRLRSLTRSITGDERPKQFVPVIGGKTLLDQTRRRVATAVSLDQTLLVKINSWCNPPTRVRLQQLFTR